MIKYVIKRILLIIPTVVIIIFVIYGIMELTPGEPARILLGNTATQEAVDRLTIELGYDKPFLQRYAQYVIKTFTGDLGTSWQSNLSVTKEVLARFPATIKVSAFAMAIAVLLGIPLGIVSAVKQYSVIDSVGTGLAMVLASIPCFWMGMMLNLLFGLKLQWLPTYGTGSFKHYILPAVSLAGPEIAILLRYTRTTLVEAIRADYIRTARAKGQKESVIVARHALPNAMLPVITVTGTEFCALLSGVVSVETVFAINGVGKLVYESILKKDVPMVTGSAIFLAMLVMIMMIIIDLIYAFIDPRIKARYKGGVKK